MDQFERQTAPNKSKMILSTCKKCGVQVGTSTDPLILEILEQAHACHEESKRSS